MMARQKSYKNFVIIFFLGISSGLPLALILSTLKASLLEKGFDLKTIGFFSLASLPYTLKFCFAPIIDSCSIPFLTRVLGQRKSWIVLTQVFLALLIFALGVAGLAVVKPASAGIGHAEASRAISVGAPVYEDVTPAK